MDLVMKHLNQFLANQILENKELKSIKLLAYGKNYFERISELAIQWLQDKYMKLSTDTCHLLIFGHKYKHQWAQIGKYMVWEENEVKLQEQQQTIN